MNITQITDMRPFTIMAAPSPTIIKTSNISKIFIIKDFGGLQSQ